MAYDSDQYWHKLAPYGGMKAYETAESLWAAAVEAFDWITHHPLKEEVLFHNKGKVVRTHIKKMRPFTWSGVAACMGLSSSGLQRYRSVEEFKEVLAMMDDVIRTQKFEGAATNLLNASLISKDLGLTEKTELTGKDGGPLQAQVTIFQLPDNERN